MDSELMELFDEWEDLDCTEKCYLCMKCKRLADHQQPSVIEQVLYFAVYNSKTLDFIIASVFFLSAIICINVLY